MSCVFISSGILNDMEFACYCQWFDHLMQQNPPKLDLIGKPRIVSVVILGLLFSVFSGVCQPHWRDMVHIMQ